MTKFPAKPEQITTLTSVSTKETQSDIQPDLKSVHKENFKILIENSCRVTKQQILKTLREFLKPSALLIQVGGYIPYLLTEENGLRTYPPLVVVSIIQLILHMIFVIYFMRFQNYLTSTFGEFTETEMVTSSAFCIVGLLGQLVLRIVQLYTHPKIVQFQSGLNNVFCELFGYMENTPQESWLFSKLYMEWIKSASSRLRRVSFILFLTILANMLYFLILLFVFAPFCKLAFTQKIIFASVTIDFSLGFFLFNGIAIWLGSYVQLMHIAFKIIHHKTENPIADKIRCPYYAGEYSHLNLFFEKIKQLEILIKQFNEFSAVFLITWLIFIITLMVNQLYQSLMWIRFQMYLVVLASVPSLIAGGTSIYFICMVSADMTSEAKESIDNFSNYAVKNNRIGVPKLHDDTFLKQVSFLHSKWQSSPCQISPGGFFVLNRRFLTTIVGIMTTYVIVLLQFTKEGVPEWIRKWNTDEVGGLTSNNASSNS